MDQILSFFTSIWAWISSTFANVLDLEGLLAGLYNQYIAPINPFLKTLMLLLAAFIFVLGTISFIKKTLKLFIVIAIIAVAIIFFTR